MTVYQILNDDRRGRLLGRAAEALKAASQCENRASHCGGKAGDEQHHARDASLVTPALVVQVSE
jgi:hypothetical protein